MYAAQESVGATTEKGWRSLQGKQKLAGEMVDALLASPSKHSEPSWFAQMIHSLFSWDTARVYPLLIDLRDFSLYRFRLFHRFNT